MSEQPNLLFLSIDALRPDRMSLHGYRRPTTPNLERFAERAIVCDRAMTPAGFTQAAMPAMLTSTRPLSYGGYDAGGFGRPPTVFRAFHDAGYDVTILSSFKWVSRFFGYGDGVDREYHLFSPKGLTGSAVNQMKSSLQAWHGGTASVEETLAVVLPVVRDMLNAIEAYCITRGMEHAADKEDFAGCLLVEDGWNYRALVRSVTRHRRELESNPTAYLIKHLGYIPKAHEWIAADWRYSRTPGKLARELVFQISNALLAVANPTRARLRATRFKGGVDGTSLANRLIRHLEAHAQDPKRPFVLYTHFFDCHVPYHPGRGPHWYRAAPRYLQKLGYGTEIDLSFTTKSRPQ